jgi:hypothetical protein
MIEKIELIDAELDTVSGAHRGDHDGSGEHHEHHHHPKPEPWLPIWIGPFPGKIVPF